MPKNFGIYEGSLLNVDTGLIAAKDANQTNSVCLSNELHAIQEKKVVVSNLLTLTLKNGLTIDLAKDQKVLVQTAKGKTWIRAIELKQHHHVVIALGGSFNDKFFEHHHVENHHVFDENMARFLALKRTSCKSKRYYQALQLALLERHSEAMLDAVANNFGYSATRVPTALFLSPESVVRAYLKECFGHNNFYAPSEDAIQIRSLLLKLKIIGSDKNNTIVLTQYEHNMLNGVETAISAIDAVAYTVPHTWSAARPFYIDSKLNNYFVHYKLEAEFSDVIDKDFAFCKVQSLSEGYKKESYQLKVANFSPFSSNGFVLSSNL